jgi:glycosyltransferase involved in cell wall biosynthesis
MSTVRRPLVDLYVIHWCAPQWCARSVESLLRSVDVDLRVHVIDNGATGGDLLAAALPQSVELISSADNVGYAGAANLALARALTATRPADYVVIAAHDALVLPETLRQCCDVADADSEIGLVGPIITAPVTVAGGAWRGWRAKGIGTWDPSKPFEDRDWISGTLLVIRPRCIVDVGGFDASLGSYVEEVDYCLRARDAGWRVGIATAARTSGIGAASKSVTVLVDVNSVVVAVKRRGISAAYPIVGRYVYWVVRGIVAGALPGRGAQRRRASLEHARDHARALVRLTRDWRRLRDVARNPDASTPRLGDDAAGTGALDARSDRKARRA